MTKSDIRKECGELLNKHWSFLDWEWPTIQRSKYHRTSTKEIPSIGMVKELVLQRLGIIPVFFFLVVLFGTQDYSGPYSNVEKGLLLLYHLLTGCSMADMGQFIPKSSFHQLHKEFYEKRGGELSQMITRMLGAMFSSVRIRLLCAAENNPVDFRHVTLFLDGHDTRVSYKGEGGSSLYSYKLKKSGFRTQVCTDINGMILFVSESMPCKDFNDGTMFVQMDMGSKIHPVDCVALDGGYTQFIDQVVASSPSLSPKNFCCPIRKQRGVPLSGSEVLFNDMFGSFRSRIESTFGELVSTFHKFSNRAPVRVTTVDTFMLQFQLACLLLNTKNFTRMLNIPVQAHHSLWTQLGFDYMGQQVVSTPVEATSNIETKLEYASELQRIQEEFLALGISDNTVEMEEEDTDVYEVERIIRHKGSTGNRMYLVKWKGYNSRDNTWVREVDLNAKELLEEYWHQEL